jgi:hypothetical protein
MIGIVPEATFGIPATTDAVAETPQEAKPRTPEK